MPQFFVYVLHCESKLADHAQHYCGATSDLRSRLIAHAKGQGARITQAYREAGIVWTVATVFTLSHRGHYEAERRIKRSHATHRYCSVCSGEEHSIVRGSTTIDLSLLGIPLKSTELAALPDKVPVEQTGDDEPIPL